MEKMMVREGSVARFNMIFKKFLTKNNRSLWRNSRKEFRGRLNNNREVYERNCLEVTVAWY